MKHSSQSTPSKVVPARLRAPASALTKVLRAAGNQAVVGVLREAKPEGSKPSRYRVVIIGSPSPGEIKANHPFQFVLGALREGADPETVWLVERTGYEAAGLKTGEVEEKAGPARVIWITPQDDVVQIINGFPKGSIRSLRVFSHGVPGKIHLRFKWMEKGLENYGLNLDQVKKATPDPFAQDAAITFDSCNTGTSDFAAPSGNLAQDYAQGTGRPVAAYTGRTSYHDVNAGTGGVVGSEVIRGEHVDLTEIGSRVLGRNPEMKTFQPVRGPKVGGFDSTFLIQVRLPASRSFEVPEGGAVVVRCPDSELDYGDQEPPRPIEVSTPRSGKSVESQEAFRERMREIAGTFVVTLDREGEVGLHTSLDSRTFSVGENTDQAVWSGLSKGTYYVEIWRPDNAPRVLPIRGRISVGVYGP